MLKLHLGAYLSRVGSDDIPPLLRSLLAPDEVRTLFLGLCIPVECCYAGASGRGLRDVVWYFYTWQVFRYDEHSANWSRHMLPRLHRDDISDLRAIDASGIRGDCEHML